jgi:hypothetical protein
MNTQIPALKELPALTLPVIHALIALWGLLDCFFGFRIFKVTVRIFTAFAGAVAAMALATQLQPASTVLFVALGVIGLICGFMLGWFLYKLGIVLLAVCAGFVLAAPFGAALGQPWSILAPCCAGLAAGLLAFVLLDPVVIVITALTGAFRLVFGVLFFFGGPSIVEYISGAKPINELLVGANRWTAIVTLAIAVVGCVVQFCAWSSGSKKKDEAEEA